MIRYEDIVYPTTEENRFKEGSVNVPVGYHNTLVDCHVDYLRMEKSLDDLKKKLKQPLTWKERITGKRIA